MSSTESVHVVVIDDVCRFALHFWSYLSGVPGFGIGSISAADDPGDFFWSEEKPRRLDAEPKDRGKPKHLGSPDGHWSVWWVEACGGIWKKQLKKVLAEIPAMSRTRFLIDVRGPTRHREANIKGGVQPYEADDVRRFIEKRWKKNYPEKTFPDDHAVFVSSYKKRWGSSEKSEPLRLIREKTTATFRSLKEKWTHVPKVDELARADSAEVKPIDPCCHILVTGAGFDLGGRQPVRGLGVSTTAKMLREAFEAADLWPDGIVTRKTAKKKKKKKKGLKLTFPVPEIYFASRKNPPSNVVLGDWYRFIDAAEDGDLDDYWEYLLRLELARIEKTKDDGSLDKAGAAVREQDLREAFRRVLTWNDWGLTRQTLDALRNPAFGVWLTTNYTRIADRGAELLESHGGVQNESWRFIATSKEATLFLREMLHSDEARWSEGRLDNRYLFKMHGDIPHVSTMALAISDKEIFSPLSMPIDSLHWVYTTAERFLEKWIRASGSAGSVRRVVWHIVGHGLKDALLVQLMARICRATSPEHHLFVIASPEEKKVGEEEGDDLAYSLAESLPTDSDGWRILQVETDALKLMAHLQADDSWVSATSEDLKTWLGRVGQVHLDLTEAP